MRMNYAGWDTTEQRNTSAIIIETIENTILVGSIIRLQVGESDPFLLLLSSLSFLCKNVSPTTATPFAVQTPLCLE